MLFCTINCTTRYACRKNRIEVVLLILIYYWRYFNTSTKDGRSMWWWVGLAMPYVQGPKWPIFTLGHPMSVTQHYF